MKGLFIGHILLSHANIIAHKSYKCQEIFQTMSYQLVARRGSGLEIRKEIVRLRPISNCQPPCLNDEIAASAFGLLAMTEVLSKVNHRNHREIF